MSEKYGCHKSPSEEYEIFICSSENTEKYYITFKDVNGSLNEVEISEQVYFEFLKSFRVMNNHRWRSWYHGMAELHENMIPATPAPNLEDIIVEREWIERIDKAISSLPTKQRRRFRLYYRKPKHIEKNMFAGYLKCSDCGANLNYKYTHDNPGNHYFSCHNKRANNGLCSRTHHIRVDTLTELVRNHIGSITRFATLFEDEFVKIVVDEHYKRICRQQKKNQDILNHMIVRNKELDTLYEKLYEEKILGNLTEERFKKLSYKYEDEQAELNQRIKHMKKVVAEEKSHEMNCDGFIEIVRRYTDVTELTPEILGEFIDKIVVHHKEKLFGEVVQRVEIYYKMIGYVELPGMSQTEKENYIKCFSRMKKDQIV